MMSTLHLSLPLGLSINFTLEPLWHDKGLPLMMMGMLLVFLALILISTFISWLPNIMGAVHRILPESEQLAAAKSAKKKDEEDSEEIVAVIAAAVSEALGRPHRVISTREITAREMAWPQQGRWQIQTSHKPQK